MRRILCLLACLAMLAFPAAQSYAQELIETVDSYDGSNISDDDEVYLIGSAVSIVVTAQENLSNLSGNVSINSASVGYSSVNRTLTNVGSGTYQYIWNTSQLSPADDYVVSVTLRGTDGVQDTSSSMVIQLYTSDILVRVDSQDSQNSEDDNEIYHAGQRIRIITEYSNDTVPSGSVVINSERTGYESQVFTMRPSTTGMADSLEYVWNTIGLREASDYVVSVTLDDRAGRMILDQSLVITIDNTPPEILSVKSYERGNVGDSDGIYHAGQAIVIDAQLADPDPGLEPFISIEAESVIYDFGPQRMTYQGEGLWRFIWTTTGLNAAVDYVVTAEFTDSAALKAVNSSLTMEIDNTPPRDGSIVINDDEPYTILRLVRLALSAESSAKMYISGDVVDSILTLEWIDYAEELEIELSHGDGQKTVSVRFMDDASNESPTVSDTIVLDALPPAIESVSSHDQTEILDNDGIYHTGQSIVIVVETDGSEPEGLEGTLSIASPSANYESGIQTLRRSSVGQYTYTWNTVGLLEASDYAVSVNLKDPSDREVDDDSLVITIDNVPPSDGQILINDGAAETDSRSIILTISASGDPREIFIEGDLVDDSNTFEWIAYTNRIIVNLTDADGEKEVKVKFGDAAGNVSGVVSAVIFLDRQAPTSASIVIEDGTEHTQARDITLKLEADNAEDMFIDGDVVDNNVTFEFISYSEQVTVKLTSGDGVKRVGVVFRNATGVKSDRVEDTIILDTLDPVILSVDSSNLENSQDSDEIYGAGQTVIISVVARSGEAELDASIRIRSQNTAYDTGEQEMVDGGDEASFTYAWVTDALQESDDYIVFVELTDAAGHKAENSDLKIAIDNSPPRPGQVIVNDGAATTDSRTVRLTISASEAVLMFVSGDVADDSNTFQWTPYRSNMTVNLSGDDGQKTVRIRFRDAADNESAELSGSINLDRESPHELDIIIAATSEGASARQQDDFAASRTVFLALSAKNAIEMYISGDAVKGASTFEWVPYSSQVSVELTQGDGVKVIRAKFRNQRGIESELIEGRITLDMLAPEFLSVEFQDENDPSDNDGWYHPGESIRIIITAVEASDPEAEIRIKSQSTGYDSGALPLDMRTRSFGDIWNFEYIWNTLDLDDGTDFIVEVTLTDEVGRATTSDPGILVLDSLPPTSAKLTINKGVRRTASRIATLEASADDAVEMLVVGAIRDDGNTFQWITVTESIVAVLTSGEGLKNVSVRFRDMAENTTGAINADIILSQSPPVIQRVDSWDTADSSDNDESYHAGELIEMALKAQARDDAPMIETGLLGTVSIASSDTGYESGEHEAREESGGWYTYAWNTSGLEEGTYEVTWSLSDGLGRETNDRSLNIVIDNTPPGDPQISIDSGAEYTRSRSVSLRLGATKAASVLIDGETLESKGVTFEWIPFIQDMRITVNLTAGDGVKLVQARFKDAADNPTEPVSAQIILDTIGPSVISIEINDGEEYTASAEVKLMLNVDDAVEMYIDGDVIAQSVAGRWIPYQDELSLELIEEDGEKIVEVEFRDLVGNFSEKVSDTIILDTTPPEVALVKSANIEVRADDDGRYLAGAKVEINADAGEMGLEANIQITSATTDYASGSQEMVEAGAGTYTYLWDTSFLQPALDYTARIEIQDKVGNTTLDESLVMAVIDEPIEQELIIGDGEEVTTSQSVSVTISGDNAAEMYISGDVVDDSSTLEWLEFDPVKELKLTPGDGIKRIEVILRDSLSREIGTVESSIKLDQTPPAIAQVTTERGTYRADDKVEISVEARRREVGLEAKIQVRSFLTGYDSGPQKATDKGNGEYVYLWDTTGLKEGDDYRVEVVLSDEAEWAARDNSLALAIDNTPPQGGEITVNSGELFTNKRSVELVSVSPEDAVDVFIEGDLVRDSNTFQWIPTSVIHQGLIVNLNVGDGEKSIRARFRDEAGNESEPIEDVLILNELPPIIRSVDSHDEDDPGDDDEIYRAGQIVRIAIEVEDREQVEPEGDTEDTESGGAELEAWVQISSEDTGYDSGLMTAQREPLGDDIRRFIVEFSTTWHTSSAPEASDYVAEVTLQDGYGQRTTDNSLIITIDNTPPETPEVSIEGGREILNSRDATLTLSGSYEGANAHEMMVEGDVAESFDARNWIPFVDSKRIELSEGDGEKSVTVKIRDSAGNVSGPGSDRIVLDSSAPSSPSIIVNDDSEYTESHAVKLSLSAGSAREMYVSGNVVKDEGTFRWVPFQERYDVRLTEGEGEKVVRVLFRNGINNESDEVEDRITLDISSPTIQNIEAFDAFDVTDDDLVFHADQVIMFQAIAGGNETGLEGSINIRSTSGQSFDTGTQEMTDTGNGRYVFLWNTEGIGDGDYLCDIALEDIAGHSATDTLEIVIDNQGPHNPAVEIGEASADSRTVRIILRADGEPVEVFIAGDVVNDNKTFEWIEFLAAEDEVNPADEMEIFVNMRGSDGEKRIAAIFRDRARSESSEAEAVVTLELKNPELASSCRITETDDDPPRAYLALQFDEPIGRIDPGNFLVSLVDKSNPQNLVQIDGTATRPALSGDKAIVEISAKQLDEMRQWQPMTFAFSYIQAEIAENGVFDLAGKGNLSNEETPADVFFVSPASSIQFDAQPPSFSPNGDGVKDKLVITYSPARASDVTIRITDPQEETVKEWQADGQAGGLVYSVEWNGKMQDDSPYPDGEYSMIIISSEVGAAGFAYGLRQRLTIDNSPPQIVNVSPWEGAEVPVMFRASVAVVDTPRASGIESVFLTVLGDIENRFPLARSEVEGEYVIPVNSEIPLPLGEQEVSFNVVDMAGNETKRTMTYSVVAEAEAALSIMNFPNPFPPGGMTNIRYALPEEAQSGKIIVFDAGGDMVLFKDLNNGELERGEHTFQWDGRDLFGSILARGIYFCRLQVSMETTDDDEVSKIAIR